jgi:methionyl-tRNA synthetase
VTFRGDKMSKSLGTALDPIEAADRFGPDPLRLYLVKEIPFGNDGDFGWERYEERYNVDLANNLGNLVSRIAAMTDRYRKGAIQPQPAGGRLPGGAAKTVAEYRVAMDAFAMHEGAAAVFRLIDATNEFIAETEPWTLARDPASGDRLTSVLFDTVEALRIVAVLLIPIMPASAAEILRRVGDNRRASTITLDADARWSTAGERIVSRGDAMWPRLETK